LQQTSKIVELNKCNNK